MPVIIYQQLFYPVLVSTTSSSSGQQTPISISLVDVSSPFIAKRVTINSY